MPATNSRVSIHAPREGCDRRAISVQTRSIVFQFTHPGRGATTNGESSIDFEAFQFTHPGRGATGMLLPCMCREMFQFTHPGRGATEERTRAKSEAGVSIHAPREGCDRRRISRIIDAEVSIHAPREGCDSPGYVAPPPCRRFNSRTPGGVRLLSVKGLMSPSSFQFTHPGRGATQSQTPQHSDPAVSIHAPREGCDIS